MTTRDEGILLRGGSGDTEYLSAFPWDTQHKEHETSQACCLWGDGSWGSRVGNATHVPSPGGSEFLCTQPAAGRSEGLWLVWMTPTSLPPGAQVASEYPNPEQVGDRVNRHGRASWEPVTAYSKEHCSCSPYRSQSWWRGTPIL